MRIQGTFIEDAYAEAFRMWACRLIVTAIDERWVDTAASVACGYGTSVIACDAEAAVERRLAPGETPDGRPGAALLFFAFNAKALGKAVPNRVGQCLMTCPTTAVYDGMPAAGLDVGDDHGRFPVGDRLRFFGDGYQRSKVVIDSSATSAPGVAAKRRLWRVPVMDGEFTCEDTAGCVKAIGGGNFMICGETQVAALRAAERAVQAMAQLPEVVAPFPGGVVRSGSKVGSRYKGMFASTNGAFCPTLRGRVNTSLPEGAQAAYEVVINGLSEPAIAAATRVGVLAACGPGVLSISAGNYGGNLGKFKFHLRKIMGE